ncbi:hypothetical protein SAMN04515674_108186 [Pseudarcicella hirudinis]|uniref:Uncharacterized protein n=1 Tax=Pseudarcicella hirudinis TaxID=1079859 RepID=A0A1I5V3R2_9BACT|nr:hypothetical protein SAMN04515674_108186 [Pseudarcicella hirudinis]
MALGVKSLKSMEIMEDKEFFRIYLEALDKALANDEVNFGFNIYYSYDYIEEETVLKQIENFEEENYNRFKFFLI